MDPTPVNGGQTIHPNNERNNVPEIEYSEAAKKHIMFRRQRMISARDARDSSKQEHDDMPFLKYIDVLKKADDQYVAPRKNAQDTSINVGTIRDKDTTLVEYAMKYDFESVAQCFDDEDEMLMELAETTEDMVKKSKQLETYRDKAKLIYRAMVAFGTAFVEDVWVEHWITEKTLDKNFKAGQSNATWTEKSVKTYDGCQAKLWDIRKCYVGDIRKFFMNGPQGQPYFFTVEYESYDVVKSMYKNWDRWKNVPTTVITTAELSSAAVYSPHFTLRPISQNYCEIIKYYDPIANEFALQISGVDMLPIMESKTTEDGIEKTLVSGFPLTEVSPSGAIPFAKFDLEPMHDFWLSKSQPGKMRVMGDVENMFIKLLIRMMKQKSDPTMGNKSGRVFGSEVSDPATIINDVREGDLFPILPNFQGATTADFSMYELVKKELDKNSVERSFQGIDNAPQDETATADMNNMKAQSLKVASMLDGIVSGESQLAWLRTYSIIANWTKPIDVQVDVVKKQLVNKYRTVTLATKVNGGQKATKKIVFTKDTTMSSDDVHQEEMDAKKEGKGEQRIAYVNPEMLRGLKMDWFYTTVPVPNDSDPLSYMMFAKQVGDATNIFGPDSLNVKRLKHTFAAKTGQDFDTWFLSEQELEQKQQQAVQQQQQDPANPNIKAPANGAGGGPTPASAVQNKVPVVGMK